MKKILLSAVIAFAALQTAVAQQPQRSFDGKSIAEKMVQRMDRALDLNDAQEKDLLKIYTEMYAQRKDAKSCTAEERKAKREEFSKQIKEVLTEEQQQKWTEFKSQQAKQGKNRQNILNRRLTAEQMVEKMDKELDLTDTQKKQVLEVYKELFSQQAENRRAGRSQFTKKINEILTESQQKKWTEIKAKQAEMRKHYHNSMK